MKKTNIGIVTVPIHYKGTVPLSNLVDVLHPLTDDIYLITGKAGYDFFKEDRRIYAYKIRHESGKSIFMKIIRFAYMQLKISYKLAKIARNVDIWFFFIGGDDLVLPMLTAKLLRKTVVLLFTGAPGMTLKVANNNLFKIEKILSKINCILSNKVVLQSERYIEEINLEKYRNKILIANRHFVYLNIFKIRKQINERKNVVGYIGGLSEIKGVLNFVHAIPKVLGKENEIKFIIGGGGNLFNEIKEFIDKNGLSNKVKLIGWLPHDKIPDYLNELKLIVIPSYMEFGPWIALEAIACGTPVLATSVGLIPNIVKDGETGFIMENNSPECIAGDIMRVLNYPDLDEIVKNARALIKEEYTYDAVVERYRKILQGI